MWALYFQALYAGLKFTTMNKTSHCDTNPNHKTIEYLELEDTHEDHQSSNPSVKAHKTPRASLSPVFPPWEL